MEDLDTFFDTEAFAEMVTVNGSQMPAIVDYRTTLALANDVLVPETSIRIKATDAPNATDGQQVTVRGVAYVIRQVLDEPPDGVLRRLVIARTA